MTKKDGAKDVKKIKKIKKVDVDDEKGNFFFIALIGLLVVGAVGAVLFLASGRESALGIAPEAGSAHGGAGDHWHWSYSVNHCGDTLTPSIIEEDPDGIHTHGQGLIHIHPFSPSSAGPNAEIGLFFSAFGGELTDDSYTPGPGEQQITLSEEQGCDGQPATLKLAYWEDAYDREAEPTEVIEENLADFTFTEDNGMVTLALVPEGEEVPRPPAERIQLQAQTNGVEYELTDQELLGFDPEADAEVAGAEATDDEDGVEEDADEESTDEEAEEADSETDAEDEESDDEAAEDEAETEG